MHLPHPRLGAGPDVLVPGPGLVRFAGFHVDPRSGELWHDGGTRQALGDQPLAVLLALIEHPGQLVSRDELRQRLWPGDTFVDFEHGLNAAVKRLRDALDDSAGTPRFIETMPRRGYRFIAALDADAHDADVPPAQHHAPLHIARRAILISVVSLALAATGWTAWRHASRPTPPRERHLTRLTFGAGLQAHPTWSPDGRFIAYACDRSGNSDIWVQPVSGGEATQVTHSAGQDLAPDWSPDGASIVFGRVQGNSSGLVVVPAFGGPERQLTAFGAHPRWSPDGSQVLFLSSNPELSGSRVPDVFVVRSSGGEPHRILESFLAGLSGMRWITWHPDGLRLSVLASSPNSPRTFELFTVPIQGGTAEAWRIKEAAGPPWSALLRQVEWEPSGAAVYLTFMDPARTDLWRVTVDPRSRKGLTAERLTGDGLHSDPAIARDGKRLAFNSQNEVFRLWSFTVDASGGVDERRPEPITAPGAVAGLPDLAGDDRILAYNSRASRDCEIWVTDLRTGTKQLVGPGEGSRSDAFPTYRCYPRWSRDQQKLAYSYSRFPDGIPGRHEAALATWQHGSGEEQMLTTLTESGYTMATDWTRDNTSILASSNVLTPTVSIGLWPLAKAPHAETAVKTLASHREYNLWQAHFSPNNRWIVFLVEKLREPGVSVLALMPATGADPSRWRMLTDVHGHADKPRWSADGRLLYFVRLDNGFYNMWALRFDPNSGTPIEAPFRITSFKTTAFHIWPDMGWMEMAVSSTRVILPMSERTGHISILDNIAR
jgi:Tol biopolymer transport system component/DNA-binding winged helix-turn-helix (wHTH) protein